VATLEVGLPEEVARTGPHPSAGGPRIGTAPRRPLQGALTDPVLLGPHTGRLPAEDRLATALTGDARAAVRAVVSVGVLRTRAAAGPLPEVSCRAEPVFGPGSSFSRQGKIRMFRWATTGR
jgi:hypothetical protein